MQNTLQIHMKTLKNRDLHHKNHTVKHFQAEYTENLGNWMRIFQKIGKFAIFFSKTDTNFQIFTSAKVLCGSIIEQNIWFTTEKTAVAINC